MIEALYVPAILLALAISGALALYGIIRQWRAERDRQPQPDEAQALLALLCEQMHERLPAGRHAAAHRHQPDGGTMARSTVEAVS